VVNFQLWAAGVVRQGGVWMLWPSVVSLLQATTTQTHHSTAEPITFNQIFQAKKKFPSTGKNSSAKFSLLIALKVGSMRCFSRFYKSSLFVNKAVVLK
jgi:hypothetical protein